jgi:hypothetical protein
VENNSSTSHSRSPTRLKPLWLTLGALCAIEGALCFAPPGYMVNTLHARMRESVTRDAAPVQIMGDSVSAGIKASVVAEQLGKPATMVSNYSLPGTSPLFACDTLRRQLAAGKAPRVIVYAPHPAHLGAPMVERFLGRFATAGEAWNFAKHGRISDTLFGTLCRLSYTLRYREELYGVVTQGDLEFFRTMKKPVDSVASSQQPQPEPPEPPERPPFRAEDLPPMLFAPFSVQRDNARSIDALCDLAEAHGITVLWVTLPCIPAFAEHWARGTDRAAYYAYLDDLARRHRNVSILHRELEAWPDKYFGDARHLNRTGAWRFSQRLGGELAVWMQAHPLP